MKEKKVKAVDFKLETPYANPNAPYSKQRADKVSKMPKPKLKTFG